MAGTRGALALIVLAPALASLAAPAPAQQTSEGLLTGTGGDQLFIPQQIAAKQYEA
jgi:hypothetical protein